MTSTARLCFHQILATHFRNCLCFYSSDESSNDFKSVKKISASLLTIVLRNFRNFCVTCPRWQKKCFIIRHTCRIQMHNEMQATFYRRHKVSYGVTLNLGTHDRCIEQFF